MEFVSPYIVFSAPSGAGKTTIVRALERKYPQMVISISATTRPPRPTEQEGRDYYFLSREEFLQAVGQGKFLEYEQVHGQYYGTLIEKVEALRRKGKVVLFDIDVNGAQAVKKHYPEALLIFIIPPSREELVKRLKLRNSESEADIRKRLQRLRFEYDQAHYFDFVVVNDDLSKALTEVERIIFRKS